MCQYFVFLLIIFCVELVAGVLGVVYDTSTSDTLRAELLAHLHNSEKNRLVRNSWDQLQQQVPITIFHTLGWRIIDNFE
jgi:hypothetical protein